MDEWILQGIIEPANSPWASPLVPVKKKDGRMRWVTDLRQLNDVTVKDAYPLTIQDNLQKLKGAKIFTSIDPCGAYHAIQIEEESRSIVQRSSVLLVRLDTSDCLSVCLTPEASTAGCWTWPLLICQWNTGCRIWTTF